MILALLELFRVEASDFMGLCFIFAHGISNLISVCKQKDNVCAKSVLKRSKLCKRERGKKNTEMHHLHSGHFGTQTTVAFLNTFAIFCLFPFTLLPFSHHLVVVLVVFLLSSTHSNCCVAIFTVLFMDDASSLFVVGRDFPFPHVFHKILHKPNFLSGKTSDTAGGHKS